MGFLDKVKEKATEALEQGKDVAQTQQLKLHLKKLESEEEEALAAFGNAAFRLWEAGSLSMTLRPRSRRAAHPRRPRGDRGQEGRDRGRAARTTNGQASGTAPPPRPRRSLRDCPRPPAGSAERRGGAATTQQHGRRRRALDGSGARPRAAPRPRARSSVSTSSRRAASRSSGVAVPARRGAAASA